MSSRPILLSGNRAERFTSSALQQKERCYSVDTTFNTFSYTLTEHRQAALKDGFEKFAAGTHCEVWMHSKALKEYKKAPASDRARVERILDHLSEQGPDLLNEEQFKPEGRFPTASGKLMVYAAKSYQLRVYGAWQNGLPRIFLCPEVLIKKTPKADQDQLKRVAKKVGD